MVEVIRESTRKMEGGKRSDDIIESKRSFPDARFRESTEVTRIGQQNVRGSSFSNHQVGNLQSKTGQAIVSNNPSNADYFKIQVAVNDVFKSGGGVVLVRNGFYHERGDLIIPNGVTVRGESVGGVRILMNGANGSIKLEGQDVYADGTVSITKGTRTLTGVDTLWAANVTVDHKIKLGKYLYRIESIDSNTQITLAGKYFDATASGATYTAAKFSENVGLENLVIIAPLVNGIIMDHVAGFFTQNIIVASPITGAGITMNQCSLGAMVLTTIDGGGADGIHVQNTTQVNFNILVGVNCGNRGMLIENSSYLGFEFPTMNNNANNGGSIQGCSTLALRTGDMAGNGNNGLELVSGNQFIQIAGGGYAGQRNGAGIKLTASSDNCNISNLAAAGNNRGVHIADASCDKNTVANNQLVGNTTAGLTDAGTDTIDDNNQT